MLFKPKFEYDDYLSCVPRYLRFYITKLKLSDDPLRIKTRRCFRNRIVRNELCCPARNTQDIDENPSICICPCFLKFRVKYLADFSYVNSSFYKYLKQLKTDDKACGNKSVKIYFICLNIEGKQLASDQ